MEMSNTQIEALLDLFAVFFLFIINRNIDIETKKFEKELANENKRVNIFDAYVRPKMIGEK
jgi:hypothetical protein